MGEGVGLLPDLLETLDVEEKKGVLALLTLVCASDGELVREEMAALEAKMGQALMHPENRREIRQMLRRPPIIEEVIAEMDENSLRLAIRDAVLIAAADGEYHEKELTLIKKIISAAGLENHIIDELTSWVDEFWKIQAKGRAIVGVSLPGDDSVLRSR
tara:strand:+ start:1962 stop:2438 length:477 start_codon:yes stop_codon:yes gene_type:complete